MGQALERFMGSDSALPTRVEREAARQVAAITARNRVAVAREVAKVQMVQDVTQEALLAVSDISAMESLLVARTPHAIARLQHIADAGTIGIASVVVGTGRSVR